MADIFISYSKDSPELTKKLAADLEAKGFTVWWDSSLTSGEKFRDVIDREIDAAHAVIVIWTANSVVSEWVISEADHAARQNKLIPVRAEDLQVFRIPKPYNTRHAEVITDSAAVVRAIERLNVKPSGKREVATPPEPARPAAPLSESAIREALALEHWQAAKSSSTPEPLYAFLGEFGETRCARLARSRLEELAKQSWVRLKTSKDEAALRAFMTDFPDLDLARQAGSRIEELERTRSLAAKRRAEAQERRARRAQKIRGAFGFGSAGLAEGGTAHATAMDVDGDAASRLATAYAVLAFPILFLATAWSVNQYASDYSQAMFWVWAGTVMPSTEPVALGQSTIIQVTVAAIAAVALFVLVFRRGAYSQFDMSLYWLGTSIVALIVVTDWFVTSVTSFVPAGAADFAPSTPAAQSGVIAAIALIVLPTFFWAYRRSEKPLGREVAIYLLGGLIAFAQFLGWSLANASFFVGFFYAGNTFAGPAAWGWGTALVVGLAAVYRLKRKRGDLVSSNERALYRFSLALILTIILVQLGLEWNNSWFLAAAAFVGGINLIAFLRPSLIGLQPTRVNES